MTGEAENRSAEEILRELEKPAIETKDVPLRVPGRESMAALTRVNDEARDKTGLPRLYVRGGEPVRVRYNEDGELAIQEMSTDTVQFELTHAADYIATPAKGDPKMVFPPRDVCRYVLSAITWSFPRLTGVTAIPVFRPDGTVVTERGYDSATSLIYDPPTGFKVSVPERPKKTDVKAALKLLGEVIGDFPYADQASLANTLALGLTPILREVIDGPIPLAAIDKPTPGTGATLLVESLAVATSGTEPGALGAVEDDNEMRKAITAKMRTGERWLFLDNVNVELKSAALARALTATVWEDRILGVSKTLRAPVRNVWVATANNLELSLEIARRSYWIRMDAQLEKPWERPTQQFRHPDLKAWVRENRSEILGALLTIGRYWFVKRKPTPANMPVMGSFEAWSKTLAGVLDAAGVEGFLENSKALYEKAISHTGLWAAFLEVWHEKYGSTGVTAAQVADDLQGTGSPGFREVLPDEFSLVDENLSRKLGRAFGNHEGVRYGAEGFHLAKVGERKRAAIWSVYKTSDDDDTVAKPHL
jgi:putative DNA primase/helicase